VHNVNAKYLSVDLGCDVCMQAKLFSTFGFQFDAIVDSGSKHVVLFLVLSVERNMTCLFYFDHHVVLVLCVSVETGA
jgi:hypothetical protein